MWKKLKKVIESKLKKYNANYWIKKNRYRRVPVSKLNNIQEVLEHPQINRNMIVDVKFSKNKKIKVAGNPIKFSNFKEIIKLEKPLLH